MDTVLFTVYHRLLDHFGPQDWWPADTPFEVIIGAILTQGVNWKNVEKAIANLAQARVLDPARLAALPEDELAELIKPAGYYRVKARKIKSFLAFLRDRTGIISRNSLRCPWPSCGPSSWGYGASAPKPPTPSSSMPGAIPALLSMPIPKESCPAWAWFRQKSNTKACVPFSRRTFPPTRNSSMSSMPFLSPWGRITAKKTTPGVGIVPLRKSVFTAGEKGKGHPFPCLHKRKSMLAPRQPATIHLPVFPYPLPPGKSGNPAPGGG